MTWLLLLLLAYPAYYASQCFYNLFRNWQKARRSGIPYVIAPVHPESIPWMVLTPMFQKQMERYLPTSIYSRIAMVIYGWEFRYKHGLAEKYGPMFIIVNMNINELSICDPEVAHEVLKRPKDFTNQKTGMLIIGKFGPNLVASRDADWARQRKFIAPNINERISSTVWRESLSQTEQMLEHIRSNSGLTNDNSTNLKKIAINVLGAAGYGQTRAWNEDKAGETAPPGYHVTYMQAMRLIVEHLVVMAFVPPFLLKLPFWPKTINDTGHAVKELGGLTRELLESERRKPSERANIMSLLVQDESGSEKGTRNLKDEEVVGNLFVFSAAGFDTTANTMAYALVLLAIHPRWQQWLIEELDDVLPTDPTADLDYNEYYPKLIRTLALMYETLRMFAPIVHLAKCTEYDVPVTTAAGKAVVIPGDTTIYINSYGVHHNPDVWDEPSTFKPDRFLAYPDTDKGQSSKPFIKPLAKGTFLPWSTGPRVCPGQKMSQVEFVSVFMTIFRNHKVEVALKQGETVEQGLKRAEEVMMDSAPELTMQMLRPRDLELRFVKR